jgi:hypothetical protein
MRARFARHIPQASRSRATALSKKYVDFSQKYRKNPKRAFTIIALKGEIYDRENMARLGYAISPWAGGCGLRHSIVFEKRRFRVRISIVELVACNFHDIRLGDVASTDQKS